MSIITLLTDFGVADWYIGSVKGVILSVDHNIQITDIAHTIDPYSIEQASFIILNYYCHYPENTVHLVVVDPGVGKKRIPLIIKTDKYFFVGPDNGIFSYIITMENYRAYIIEIEKLKQYRNQIISDTFHARDLFGPAAAFLSTGIPPEELGSPFNKDLVLKKTDIEVNGNEIIAKVIYIDHFGNIISNFSKNKFQQIKNRKIKRIGINKVSLIRLMDTYSDVKKGEYLALWGSHGFLEISINQGNAAKTLNCLINKDVIKIELE